MSKVAELLEGIKKHPVVLVLGAVLGLVSLLVGILSNSLDIGEKLGLGQAPPSASASPAASPSATLTIKPSASSTPTASSAPAATDCRSLGWVTVPCDSAHAYEGLDGPCNQENVIGYLGGVAGRDVVMASAVQHDSRCWVHLFVQTNEVVRDRLAAEGPSADLRQCVDERTERVVGCDQNHSGEYLATGETTARASSKCEAKASSYMGKQAERRERRPEGEGGLEPAEIGVSRPMCHRSARSTTADHVYVRPGLRCRARGRVSDVVVEGARTGDGSLVGPVEVGPVAHGGHCVARLDVGDGGPGRVVFVRHALPGERVLLRVTDTSHARFWRADATEVLVASPARVVPRCPVAGPGLCGGCDWQHASLVEQRRLKTAVVAEQLQRLAGLTWEGEVEAVPVPGAATDDGLGWRTRMRYHVDDDGRAGLRGHRSSELVPVPEDGCPIASPRTPPVTEREWPAGAELVAGGTPTGSALLVDGKVRATSGDATADGGLRETVRGRAYEVPPGGFWQVHPAAATVLVDAVLEGLAPHEGERAFDLYCGVGLFAGALVDAGCQVWGLESGRTAVAAARRNLADAGHRARFTADQVEQGLPRLPRDVDLVVLDPPRSGAGARVLREIVGRQPRAVAYVACDPAALARDLATAAQHGYAATSIRAFDLFPMTQHVECVAILEPVG